MWDLTVSHLHTFLVGAGRFVVHNACGHSAEVDLSSDKEIQHEMVKHGGDFGASTHDTKPNRDLFRQKLTAHLENPDTIAIVGRAFGEDATHYVNYKTALNVFARADGRFWGAWKLGPEQFISVLTTGRLF
jgi:colicin D